MGQAQELLTPQSQQLNVPTSAVASATGTATFLFQSPPTGLVWTGTLTCAGAPPTAVFLATIGATSWGDWGGNSVYGPVQAFANQQLLITVTGLTANEPFEIVWAGSSDAEGSVQPIWPDTNTSAITAALAPPGLAFGPTVANLSGGTASVNVTGPSSTRTLIIEVANPPAVPTNIAVFGNQSLLVYRSGPPYLQNEFSTNTWLVVVPVLGVADSSYTIRVDAAGVPMTFTLTVWADSDVTQESVFYNGVIQVKSVRQGAAGTVGVLVGPCRLLTAQVSSTAAGQVTLFNVGGSGLNLIEVDAATETVSINFPPNTILPIGQGLSLFQSPAGVSAAQVTYAYP